MEINKAYIAIIFFIIACGVAIIYYPIGVYDLDRDMWNKGNVTTALLEHLPFAKDPYLSEFRGSKMNTEMYIAIPFRKLFKSYEQYVACSSFIFYLAGLFLLYVLVKLITDDDFIALVVSIVFSSSTVGFPTPGDMFTLIFPGIVWGKALSYLGIIFILLVYLKYRDHRYIDDITIVLSVLTVWIYPLAFLGPTVALILYIIAVAILKKQFLKSTRLILMAVIPILPYVALYAWSTRLLTPTVSGDDLRAMESTLRLCPNSMAWNPFSVFRSFIKAFSVTNGYSFLAMTVLLMPFVKAKKDFIRFFSIIGILILPVIFILKLIGFRLHSEMYFFMIDRNVKWSYFFFLLVFISSYNTLRDMMLNSRFSSKRIHPRYVYILAFSLAFIVPLKTTFTDSSFGTRFWRTVISAPFLPQSVISAVKEKLGLDINDINRDAESISAYIIELLPADGGMVGPSWIPYKTHRGLSYDRAYIHNLVVFKKINEARRLFEIMKVIESLEANDVSALEKLRESGVNYLMFEKFKADPIEAYLRYIPDEAKLHLRDSMKSYIEFENDNFFLLRTSEERQTKRWTKNNAE